MPRFPALPTHLSTQQVVFFRNIASLIMLLPILMRTGFSELKTQRFHWHLMRALVGLSAMYCYFFVLARMPLIAYIWLKESIGPNTRWVILIGFIGVAFILRPGSESISYFAIIGLGDCVLLWPDIDHYLCTSRFLRVANGTG
jgi:drug/metabolite transporter (DMT)-like permease